MALVTPPFSGEAFDAESFLRREIPAKMSGPAWSALIKALATCEQPAWDNAPRIARDVLLGTALGKYLDRRAAGVGVDRPADVGMPDGPFRDLAVELSSGQVTFNSLLRVLTAFYGVAGTHAHVTSSVEPYALADGEVLAVTFDGLAEVDVVLRTADFIAIGSASATEVAGAVNRAVLAAGYDHSAVVEYDTTSGANKVTIYTATLGARGSVQVASGAAQAALGLGTTLARLFGQPRNAYVFPLGTGAEVVFPATTDVVARDRTTAAYVNDSPYTIFYGAGLYYGSGDYGPLLGVTGNPRGPYLFEGTDRGLSMTVTSTTTSQVLLKDHEYRLVQVADSSQFPDSSGWLVLGYGYDWQASPVPYVGTAGSAALVLDPSFRFPVTVPSGASVRLLSSNAVKTLPAGAPGKFWLTDSPAGRVAAEASVDEAAAVGIELRHSISYPGDVGLGNAGRPTHGVQDVSDIVGCFSGNDVDAEVAAARSA